MKTFLAAAAMLAMTPMTGWGAEIFVVDAKGIDLAAGQSLDGAKPLVLAVGARVTFVTNDGRTIKVKGPFDSAPAPDADRKGGDVIDSLKGLFKAREADTTSAGIIRKGTVSFAQPAPWLFEVGHNGDRCLVEGEKTVLWRADVPAANGSLEITPIDHSWTAKAKWPAGSDKLALPASLKLNNGQTYLLTLDAEQVTVTVHVIPRSVRGEAARAAWMIEMGCEPQAKSIVEAMQ